MLLIGLEDIPVAIQAESFRQQPVAAAYHILTLRVVGLVTKAGELPAFPLHGEAVLQQLGGENVEEADLAAQHFGLSTLRDGVQDQMLAQHLNMLLLQGDLGHDPDGLDDAFVAPDVQLSLIFAGHHQIADLAHHPDNAQQMVAMGVGHDQMTDGSVRHVCLCQLGENAVAAAGIHKDVIVAALQGEAGVVTLGHHGVAGAKNDQFFHIEPLLYSDFYMEFYHGAGSCVNRNPSIIGRYY